MSDAVPYRCHECHAPLTYVDGRTRVPHVSWCKYAPRPARVTVLAPTPPTEPLRPDETEES